MSLVFFSKRNRYFPGIFLLFLLYLVSAKAGLALDAVSGFATLVWIPSGLSLATLLIFGIGFWPGIFAGALVANFSSGAPIYVAFLIAVGNTLEALVATWVLKKFHFRTSLDRLRDAVVFIIVAAFFSTTISANMGVLSLFTAGIVSKVNIFNTWSAWWVGDMISDLVFAPLILVFAKNLRAKFNLRLRDVIEAFGVVLTVVVAITVIFLGYLVYGLKSVPRIYLLFPPLIWASLRFGQLGAVLLTFFVWAASTYATARGLGPLKQLKEVLPKHQ